MSSAHMLVSILGGLLGGLALGGLYFAALAWSVHRLAQGAGGASSLLASFAVRVACAAVVFLIAARNGGLAAIVAMLAGFLAVRIAVTSRRSAPERRP